MNLTYRLYKILANVKEIVLPNPNMGKELARKVLDEAFRSSSVAELSNSIYEADDETLKLVVNLAYPGKKARTRSFLMAQLVCAMLKIYGEVPKQRTKIVAVLVELVSKGATFDWTKASKTGFSIKPIGSSNTMAVDHFTGEQMNALKRRLRSYDMTPAAYEKIFNLDSVRMTSIRYSNTQKTKTKHNRPVPGSRKIQANKISSQIKNIVETISSVESQSLLPAIGLLNKAAERKSTRGLKSILTGAIEVLYDARVGKADRDKISSAIVKLQSLVTVLNAKNSETSSYGDSLAFGSLAAISYRLSVLIPK